MTPLATIPSPGFNSLLSRDTTVTVGTPWEVFQPLFVLEHLCFPVSLLRSWIPAPYLLQLTHLGFFLAWDSPPTFWRITGSARHQVFGAFAPHSGSTEVGEVAGRMCYLPSWKNLLPRLPQGGIWDQ